MTQQQFNEACIYANAELEDYEIQEALAIMDETRCPLYMVGSIADKIIERMDEWCIDNDLNEDDWREWGDEEDVFFNVN